MACQCSDDKSCHGCVKDLARTILDNNKQLQKLIVWEGYEDDGPQETGTNQE